MSDRKHDHSGHLAAQVTGADAAMALLLARPAATAAGTIARCTLRVPEAVWTGCASEIDRAWRIAAVVSLVAARLVPPDSVLILAIDVPDCGLTTGVAGPVDPQSTLALCDEQLRTRAGHEGDASVGIGYTSSGDVQLTGASAAGITRLGALTQRALDALARPGRMTADAAIRSSDLLDATELRHLSELAGRRVEYARDATIADRFEAIAQRWPQSVALRAHDGELRYAELDERSNRFARHLIDAGVRPAERIAVALDRSVAQIVAYLGIAKAGGVFVPLDARMPATGTAALLERIDVHRVVVGDATVPSALPAGMARIRIDNAIAPRTSGSPYAVASPPRQTRAEDAAYVMFTSGSTGEPKGVVVPHRAVVRLATCADYLSLDPDTVMLGYAPVSFDASTLEIWGPLLNGGRLVLAPPGLLSLDELSAFVASERCTTVWLTSGLFNELVDAGLAARLQTVRDLLTGGDVVSPAHVRRAMGTLPRCAFVNGYGPTENTTFSCCFRVEPGMEVPAPLPIGRPIPNSSAHVLDADGVAVPVGAIGELWVGGDGVALGYAGGTAADDRRFVHVPGDGMWAGRRYRTGDLVRWRDDGCLEFLGRADTQVKLRGFRVEPGEIEAALRQHPTILDAVVVPTGSGARRRLVAHVIAHAGATVMPAEVRTFLASRLAEYMLPATITVHERLPTTASGKVDRRALSALDTSAAAEPDAPPAGTKAQPDLEGILCAIFARVLDVPTIQPTDGFFERGGASLSALVVLDLLRREHGITLSVADFFQAPSPAGAAARILAARGSRPRQAAPTRAPPSANAAIAVVGMAGRFPGARSVDAFWQAVCDGVDTVDRFDVATLDASVPDADRSSPDYVAARGMLDGVEQFAAGFFGVPRRQAELMDPQLRVLTEVAWEALESCGLVPERSEHTIGVFAGMNVSGYLFHHVLQNPERVRAAGPLPVQFATEKDYVATGLAHRLDLTGPAVSISTACSTSLVAIAQACLALRAGQCDAALAGGVSITVPQRVGHVYDAGSMLSQDGTTRPFDRDATGTVFSDGAGIVILKRLADAQADGDTIHAVIRGVAVNNDGARRASFTAPSVDGQRRVIRRALDDAAWTADTIGYVEAHGTATPLGDPIEVEALTRTYREDTDATGFCALGSVKGNIGHCTIAAGVAGFIKTVLALRHGVLPASLHFEHPNPQLAIETTPFVVNATTRPWPSDGRPRRAGVSAFGVGGTNAHVLLEAYVPDGAAPVLTQAASPLLLPFSAETPEQLATLIAETAARLPDTMEGLADVAYTLGVGRRVFRHRAFAIAHDPAEAKSQLQGGVLGRLRYADAGLRPARTVFLFAGQGTQHPGMASALHRSDPVFRAALDEAMAAVATHGIRLDELLLDASSGTDAAERLRQTEFAQPAIFAMQVAMARLWVDRGVQPDAVLGHSVGEFAAAVVAGVLDLSVAATLVAARGRAMQTCAPGRMLSVRAAIDAVTPFLSDHVELAADNAPALCVLSGTAAAIGDVAAALDRAGVPNRLLETSHAFHSAQMEPAMAAFEPALAGLQARPARCTFVSSCTGSAIGNESLGRAEYWIRQLRAPVRFRAALLAAADDRGALMLDVGPRSAVAPLARQTFAWRHDMRIVSSFDDLEGDGDEAASVRRAAGNAWIAGASVDLAAVHGGTRRRRVALSPYPLHRERYWLERAEPGGRTSGRVESAVDVTTLIERQQEILRLQLSLLAGHV